MISAVMIHFHIHDIPMTGLTGNYRKLISLVSTSFRPQTLVENIRIEPQNINFSLAE